MRSEEVTEEEGVTGDATMRAVMCPTMVAGKVTRTIGSDEPRGIRINKSLEDKGDVDASHDQCT
jgi:hypothetical protein